MSAEIEIPQHYWIYPVVSGGLDLDLDNIHIKELPTITLKTESTLNSQSKVDMGLDNIRIRELPRIELHTQIAAKPTRVHLPLNYKVSIGTLGLELLTVNLCGEGMIVIEDYVKHKTEECI